MATYFLPPFIKYHNAIHGWNAQLPNQDIISVIILPT
jgi:hypothetical protein